MVRPLRDAYDMFEAPSAIKLLDLLTNRYHTGVVRMNAGAGLEVEVPANMPITPGQRLRFVVDEGLGLISRTAMKAAQVAAVDHAVANRMRVYLDVLPDAA